MNDDNDSTVNDKIMQDEKDWRDEHGHPSNEFLQELADDGGPAALEKLRAIAGDLDAEYGPNDSAEDLIEAIRSVVEHGPNTTS